MSFTLNSASIKELTGVHPKLVEVVKKASEYSTVEFGVVDGLRTLAEQKQLLAKGATTTLNSKHIKQADGYGHAVDLVPIINGKYRWEWGPIWNIALAMDAAATELDTLIVWGAVWDRNMDYYGGSIDALKSEVEAYKKRRYKLGKKKVFLDGPHYQIVV